MGTKLSFSTTYHPQTDGQSESTMKTLEEMLRASVLDFGGEWDGYLSLCEFAYNNSFIQPLEYHHLKYFIVVVVERPYVGKRLIQEVSMDPLLLQTQQKRSFKSEKS